MRKKTFTILLFINLLIAQVEAHLMITHVKYASNFLNKTTQFSWGNRKKYINAYTSGDDFQFIIESIIETC